MKKLVVVAGLVLLPATAAATPQPLPFTYVYETLPKGSLEVEQYADYTPAKALSAGTAATVFYGASQFQTEFEYGITDRLELGLYVTFEPNPGSAFVNVPRLTEGNGLKERLRLRLAEEGQWPVDIGLYGELVENDQEIELEGKIIVQRRIGNLRVVANLWGEREYNYVPATANGHIFSQADWVINPTLGATYQVTPSLYPGVEGWLRAEFPSGASGPRAFNLGPSVYVGPTMMFNFGNFWWSTGLYLRASDFGRSLQAADAFGSVWARMIIGLSF
jgi:hypothetical protein